MKLDEDLIYEILSAVGEIPYGRVATYGQIARLIGIARTLEYKGLLGDLRTLYADGERRLNDSLTE